MKCSDIRLEKQPDVVEEQVHEIDIFDEETKETTKRNVIRKVIIKGEELEVKCTNRPFAICNKCKDPVCETHYFVFNFDRSKEFCTECGRVIQDALKKHLEKLVG